MSSIVYNFALAGWLQKYIPVDLLKCTMVIF